jgi:hypothetical protein
MFSSSRGGVGGFWMLLCGHGRRFVWNTTTFLATSSMRLWKFLISSWVSTRSAFTLASSMGSRLTLVSSASHWLLVVGLIFFLRRELFRFLSLAVNTRRA